MGEHGATRIAGVPPLRLSEFRLQKCGRQEGTRPREAHNAKSWISWVVVRERGNSRFSATTASGQFPNTLCERRGSTEPFELEPTGSTQPRASTNQGGSTQEMRPGPRHAFSLSLLAVLTPRTGAFLVGVV